MKQIIMHHIKAFSIGAILIVLCNVLSVIHPYLVKQVVDIDFSGNNVTMVLMQLVGLYCIVHIFLTIMKNIKNRQINKTMASILSEIREKLFEKVLKFKMKTFDKYNSSEIYTRLTADTQNLFDLFFGTLQILVNNVVYIIFMVAMMFFANIHLAMIGLATIFIVATSSLLFTKRLKRLDNMILLKRDKENREYSEQYNRNKLTYLFGLQEQNIQKANQLLDEELIQRKKYIFTNTFMFPASILLEAFGIYAVLYYALNINIGISLGELYLVLFYIKQCRSPLTEIFDQLEEMQTCLNSLRKINHIFKEKEEEEVEKGEDATDLNGDIEFKNVHMCYGKEEILKGISFVIHKGDKVTIAGRTGAGKTTLTNIFMRLYDIQKGQILMNGYDISKISIPSLRANISYISQNPYIFKDTLRNNLILNDASITDEQIGKVIDELQVAHIFAKFSKGLEEIIQESKLSIGELQVIAFIRAILHKANIYIFDEPTSNIDLKTERLIQNLVDRISKNSTVIIVAHRKSTLETSNKIIYLKDGKIDAIINKEKQSKEKCLTN